MLFQMKYRIVTNGPRYRIQKKGSFLFFMWITCNKIQYHLLKGLIKREPVEFDSTKKAKKWIYEELQKQTLSHQWRLAEGTKVYGTAPFPLEEVSSTAIHPFATPTSPTLSSQKMREKRLRPSERRAQKVVSPAPVPAQPAAPVTPPTVVPVAFNVPPEDTKLLSYEVQKVAT